MWFNPDLYSRNYFVPGVIANIVMMVTLMLAALSIVREKEIGTMEQLMVTPVRPIELMLGKTLPFALVNLQDVTLDHRRRAAGVPHSAARKFSDDGSFFYSTPAFMLSGFAFPHSQAVDEARIWHTVRHDLAALRGVASAQFDSLQSSR